jgi:hypothetical protein
MKTPWAVLCPTHGQVFLAEDQYFNQLDAMDHLWVCPICGSVAGWDDENYDQACAASEAKVLEGPDDDVPF